jgi:hypothetical protein
MMDDDPKMSDWRPVQSSGPDRESENDRQLINNSAPIKADEPENAIPSDQPMPADPETGVGKPSSPILDDLSQPLLMGKPTTGEKAGAQEIPTSDMRQNEIEGQWFNRNEIEDLQSRWTSIQIQFVEDPCSAIEQGEAIVAETIERVTQMITEQQQSLGHKWLNHDDITTEELRLTLLDYRSLMNHLLNL